MTNGDPNQRGSNQSSLMGGQQMIMLQLLRHMQRNRRRRRVSTLADLEFFKTFSINVTKVSWVFEDCKFNISEGYKQN